MKIVILGIGFLGRKLIEYFSKDYEIIGADIKEKENIFRLDATDKETVKEFLFFHKPDMVIDTVALTSSIACEKNPDLAYRLNYLTAKNIAEVCGEINAKMIFISSSYLFDGEKGDYSEKDRTNPKNEYAKKKILAEQEILKLKNSLILRVDIMYGLNSGRIMFGASNFEKGIIEVGYPEQMRSPVFIDDVPRIAIQLIEKNQCGIFHVAGPTKIKMIDFLKKLASVVGKEGIIKIVDSTGWVVKSPKDSSLDTSKINSLGIRTTSFEEALKILAEKVKL